MIETLHARIARVAKETQFSGAVRASVPGEETVTAAFGLADRTHDVPNRIDTRFGIASGTKLLTALGIAALVEDGELDFASRLRDVSSWEMPGLDPEVTIDYLLTHQSGAYDYYDEDEVDSSEFVLEIPPYRLLRPSDYLPMLFRGDPKFSPGERFSYSNGGYVLLGIVIEELTGDFHRFLESRILAPAGMTSSGFFRFDRLPRNTASGYVDAEDGWNTNIYDLPRIGGPDGGAFVSVADMESLWRSILTGQLLSETMVRNCLSRVAHVDGPQHYGRGVWIREDDPGQPVLYVVGADAGVSFRSSCYGDDTIVTVVSNTSDGAWPLSREIDQWVREVVPPEGRSFALGLGQGLV